MTSTIGPKDVMAVVDRGGPESLDWLARWIKLTLAAVPQSVWEANKVRGVKTPDLVTLLGLVTLTPEENKRFRIALGRVKGSGKLDGYWTPHPTRVYMGHPLMLWHLPGQAPDVCKPPEFPILPEMF